MDLKSRLQEVFEKYQDAHLVRGSLIERIENLEIEDQRISFDMVADGLSVAQKWQTVKALEANLKASIGPITQEIFIRPVIKDPNSVPKPVSRNKDAGSHLKNTVSEGAQVQTESSTTKEGAAAPTPNTSQASKSIPGVHKIVVVGSGKGGVGKSTVALNMALALAKTGLKVGLLDADFYGPSQTIMMGATESPIVTEQKKIKPVKRYGINFMSFGFFLQHDQPAIWRGPMLQGALRQFFFDVEWGELDVLVVDLPPGTGDVQLSLCQMVSVDGAVVVSTPQDVALADTLKGYNMFKKLNVNVYGFVENMSLFHCPQCGHESNIFGKGGVEKSAKKLGVPFLGGIPLELEVREAADQGLPILFSEKTMNGHSAQAFEQLAFQILPHIKQQAKKKGFFSWVKK